MNAPVSVGEVKAYYSSDESVTRAKAADAAYAAAKGAKEAYATAREKVDAIVKDKRAHDKEATEDIARAKDAAAAAVDRVEVARGIQLSWQRRAPYLTAASIFFGIFSLIAGWGIWWIRRP